VIQRMISSIMALAMIAVPLAASEQKEKRSEVQRLENCGTVLKEVLDIPDDIPSDLLDKAECVIVIPSVIKFALGISGNYGKGAMTCRTGEHFTGPWSAPAMMRLEGIGIGFQIGGQATDFFILVMNPRGAKGLLKSKMKLGADAAVAAGPKGRDAAAASDLTMRAEMLTYSRSRGLFVGVSLEGSTLRQDNRANQNMYGRKVDAESIVRKGAVGVPASGRVLIALLNKKSPKNLSDPESLKQ
jgi:lipid-binding SYLF domain-containing protein